MFTYFFTNEFGQISKSFTTDDLIIVSTGLLMGIMEHVQPHETVESSEIGDQN